MIGKTTITGLVRFCFTHAEKYCFKIVLFSDMHSSTSWLNESIRSQIVRAFSSCRFRRVGPLCIHLFGQLDKTAYEKNFVWRRSKCCDNGSRLPCALGERTSERGFFPRVVVVPGPAKLHSSFLPISGILWGGQSKCKFHARLNFEQMEDFLTKLRGDTFRTALAGNGVCPITVDGAPRETMPSEIEMRGTIHFS